MLPPLIGGAMGENLALGCSRVFQGSWAWVTVWSVVCLLGLTSLVRADANLECYSRTLGLGIRVSQRINLCSAAANDSTFRCFLYSTATGLTVDQRVNL